MIIRIQRGKGKYAFNNYNILKNTRKYKKMSKYTEKLRPLTSLHNSSTDNHNII